MLDHWQERLTMFACLLAVVGLWLINNWDSVLSLLTWNA